MGKGNGRCHGGGTTSRLPVKIGTPAMEVRRQWSGEGPAKFRRRSGEVPAKVRRRRRRSGGGLAEAVAPVATQRQRRRKEKIP